MAAILFNHAERFEQIDNTSSTECTMLYLVKIDQAVLEKKTRIYNEIVCMYIAQGQKAINPGAQTFDCNGKGLLLWSYIERFSHWSLIHFEKLNF